MTNSVERLIIALCHCRQSLDDASPDVGFGSRPEDFVDDIIREYQVAPSEYNKSRILKELRK